MIDSVLKGGDQVAYIPTGSINHPDVEYGFITSVGFPSDYAWASDYAWVRYWHKKYPNVLRTVSVSEMTPLSNLTRHISHDQSQVNALMKDLGYQLVKIVEPSLATASYTITLNSYDIDAITSCADRVRTLCNLPHRVKKRYRGGNEYAPWNFIGALEGAAECLLITLESRLDKDTRREE